MSDVNASFSDYIGGERERLATEREYLLDSRRTIDAKLAELDRELDAINAYERAKTGKADQPQRTGTKRARSGSRRVELMTMIGEAVNGLSRREILERMGLKGNRAGENAISNALTMMTKAGKLERADGRYHAPATALHEAAE